MLDLFRYTNFQKHKIFNFIRISLTGTTITQYETHIPQNVSIIVDYTNKQWIYESKQIPPANNYMIQQTKLLSIKTITSLY